MKFTDSLLLFLMRKFKKAGIEVSIFIGDGNIMIRNHHDLRRALDDTETFKAEAHKMCVPGCCSYYKETRN